MEPSAKEFGDDSSVYRAFVRWQQKAIFDILWAILLTKCDDLQGVDWQWQSAEGYLGKACGVPESGIGDRGTKRGVRWPQLWFPPSRLTSVLTGVRPRQGLW